MLGTSSTPSGPANTDAKAKEPPRPDQPLQQKIWDDAFNNIENHDAKLVEEYIIYVAEALRGEKAHGTSAAAANDDGCDILWLPPDYPFSCRQLYTWTVHL